MADNVSIEDVTTPGETIAADEISGAKYQRVKLIHGADGVNDGDVASVNPLPVATDGVQSSLNTTVAPLTGGATYTGTYEGNGYPDVMVSCQTDVAGTLYFDFSPDGTNDNSFPVAGFTVAAGIHEFHTAVKGPRQFRVRFVNGASAQSSFRLYTYFGLFRQGNAPINQSLSDDSDATVVKSINDETLTMTGKYSNRSIETKFGRNLIINNASVPEDVWQGGGVYTGFPSAAETVNVVSSSGSDTSAGVGARTVVLYGLDSDYNAISETITLNGTSNVLSSNSYLRLQRAIVVTAGTSEVNVGTLTMTQSSSSAVMATISAGYGQTQIAAFTVPAGKTAYVVQYSATLQDSGTNRGVIAFRVKDNTVTDGSWRVLRTVGFGTDAPLSVRLYGGIRLTEKTDAVARVLSVTSNGADVSCEFTMLLIDN